MRTINTTLKVQDHNVTELERWLARNFDLVDFRIVPDTEELYENDSTFRKLVKLERNARNEKLKYINEWNDLKK